MNKEIQGTYFDHVENEITEKEKQIIELIDSYTKIKENLEILIEKKLVHEKSLQLINRDFIQQYQTLEFHSNFLTASVEDGQEAKLNFVSGVVNADDELRMRRMIFRATKGRALATFFDMQNFAIVDNVVILDNTNQTKIDKKIFTILYFGEVQNYIMEKIIKICDLFNCSRYTMPYESGIKKVIEECEKEINEQQNFLCEADASIRSNLRDKLGEVI